MPERRGEIGNAILKNDHSIKESKLFIDNISISTYNNAMSPYNSNCIIINLLPRKIYPAEVK